MRREKYENEYKINLIYDSKWKDNDIGRNILMKTHNLTGNRARNDPIDHRIKGFSFHDFDDKIHHSRGDFSLFFQQNLDFKHSLEAKIDLEEEEIKRFKD